MRPSRGLKVFNTMEYLFISTSVNLLIVLTHFLFLKTTNAVLHFQLIESGHNNPVDIKRQELYVAQGVDVKVICMYSSNEGFNNNCSSKLFWQWNERRFENRSKSISQCLSILHIDEVQWKGKQTFVCIYEGYINNRREQSENRSLDIISGRKPRNTSQISIQWIEDELEIAWIPNEDNDSITETKYTVEYFTLPKKDQNAKTILPGFCDFSLLITNCSRRKEFHCKTSFPARLKTIYNVQLVAENKFGMIASEHMKVSIPVSQQGMMVKPVKNLKVFLTNSGVEINWSEGLHYLESKKVWYRCQGSAIIYKNFTKSNIFEISKNNLPVFTFCLFCVSRQIYHGGQYSCDQCKTIRTAEDIPQGFPQLMSCQNNSCPFARFGIFKNVTISWRLPSKRLWNGQINRQLIFYYEENKRELRNITIRDSYVTQWTLKLSVKKSYHVFMVICTNAGCGGKSNVIHIPGLLSSTETEFQFLSNTGLIVGLTLGILMLCFTCIFVFLYIKRHAVEMLPPLQEPENVPEEESNQPSALLEAEYDHLEYRNSAKL